MKYLIVLCLGLSMRCAWAPSSHVVQVSHAPARQSQAVKVKYDRSWSQEGIASYYAHKFHGRRTASGRIYDMNQMVAAHKELPFGTMVRVTNLSNKKYAELEIVDRGPFVAGRVIDVSYAAARHLDFIKQGTVRVKVEIIK